MGNTDAGVVTLMMTEGRAVEDDALLDPGVGGVTRATPVGDMRREPAGTCLGLQISITE